MTRLRFDHAFTSLTMHLTVATSMALKGSSSIMTGRHEIVASTYQSFLAIPLERPDMGSPRNPDRPNASLRYVGASSPDHLRIPKISVHRLDDGVIVRKVLLRQRAPYHKCLRHLGGGRIVEYATAGRAMLAGTHVPIARRCFGPPLIGGPQGRAARAASRRGATPRQPAGHYGKWPNWANVLTQPPARLRGGVAPGLAHDPRRGGCFPSKR